MKENQVSLTAIMTAYLRAYHTMNDNPKIFDDFLADPLIPEERRRLIEQGFSKVLQNQIPEGNLTGSDQAATFFSSLLQTMGLPNVLSRSRYNRRQSRSGYKTGSKAVCNTRSRDGYLCFSSSRSS